MLSGLDDGSINPKQGQLSEKSAPWAVKHKHDLFFFFLGGGGVKQNERGTKPKFKNIAPHWPASMMH